MVSFENCELLKVFQKNHFDLRKFNEMNGRGLRIFCLSQSLIRRVIVSFLFFFWDVCRLRQRNESQFRERSSESERLNHEKKKGKPFPRKLKETKEKLGFSGYSVAPVSWITPCSVLVTILFKVYFVIHPSGFYFRIRHFSYT